MKRHQILISAVTALMIGSLSAAEAQPIPSSAVACYLVGRFYVDPTTGKGEVAGYFTDINGIGASDSLFKGMPSESTAYFTFRAMLSAIPLPSNGDITLLLGSAGTYDIYYNPALKSDWSNPDTFSGGQLVAHFRRPEFLSLQFDSFSFTQHAITETLVSSQAFTFNGHRYNFRELTPGGITLYNYVSNTPLPPAVVAGFSTSPIVLPYAGNCIAVASGDQDEQ
jgi:hypothetical protein